MSIKVRDPLGTTVLLREERLLHIIYRHPELKNREHLILDAVRNPLELYKDDRGCFHSIAESDVISDYLVVIYCREGEVGIIRTSYFISRRRKERRYRWFRRLI
ncbi:MAG: hypothetical protein J7J65_05760 [Candidatus Korarchaeota archaeon]|nr:hypothetical protein [Candidatus Korarchaeota archaeon]